MPNEVRIQISETGSMPFEFFCTILKKVATQLLILPVGEIYNEEELIGVDAWHEMSEYEQGMARFSLLRIVRLRVFPLRFTSSRYKYNYATDPDYCEIDDAVRAHLFYEN